MIISLYEQIADLYNNHLNESWSAKLLELGLSGFTKEIFSTYKDIDAKKVIMFIFACNSLDSKRLILRSSLSNNQQMIAEQLEIPKNILDDGLFDLEKDCLQKLAKQAQWASNDEKFHTFLSLKRIKQQLTDSAEEALPKKLDEKDKREFMKRKSQDSLNALKHSKEIAILEEQLKNVITVNDSISKNIRNSSLSYEEILERTNAK